MRGIGIISDTHGLLRPKAAKRLTGVAHIIHGANRQAGLRRTTPEAPVTAIRGNIDSGQWAEGYRETEMVRLGGFTIYVLHDIEELRLDPAARGVDVVVPATRIGRESKRSGECSTLILIAPGRGASGREEASEA